MLSPNQTNMVVLEEKDQEEEEPIVAHEQVATSSNDPINTSIIKGKRTKRQRPQSPISFCLNLNTDDNNDNDNNNTPESEESRSDICINIQDTNTNANTSVMLSDDSHTYKSKVDEEEGEEEYDIANCLILLAQGLPRYLCETSNNDDPYYKPPPSDQKKFTSKKFMETPYGDKAGYYVYECKTCFKTFPSFQALGGHRASHMKPKKEEERTNNLTLNDVQCLNAYNDNHYTNNNTNPNLFNNANNKKPRIHECSTCGAEFLSGQALGGHMRRHRAPVGGARIDNSNGGFRHNHSENYFPHEMPSSLSFNNSMMANTANVVEGNIGKPPLLMEAKKLYLNLDLNLAAPVEDESSKIHSTSKE